ncbi:MAG: T9SS type A sorting domain-containing protein [Chitinophagales bacterium]|nr:T9SS type A sorting domain-containing protein [Chitinophagales bacterium]
MKYLLLLSIYTALFSTSIIQAQNRYYVRAAATGANTGVSWADAFTDLQAALQIAVAGDEVWVAEGVYYPTADTVRNISFEPKSGVQVYGGFAGNETAVEQRDWTTHVSMLSGDIGVQGDSTDNSLNVMYLFQPDTNTVVDGFTLCFGRADDEPASSGSRHRAICGGGLYIEAGNWDALATIRHCRFWRNSSLSFGGGAMTNGASMAGVAPRFIDCRFEENHAAVNGGGMARFGGSWKEQGNELESCVFEHNRANSGGGLYYADSNGPNRVSVVSCIFERNRASNAGGAVFLATGKNGLSHISIKGCDFKANVAPDAAALKLFLNGNDLNGDVVIDGCQFLEHKSMPGEEINTLVNADQISSFTCHMILKKLVIENNNTSQNTVILTVAFADLAVENLTLDGNYAPTLFRTSNFINNKLSYSTFQSNECINLGVMGLMGDTPKNYISNSLFLKNKTTTESGLFSTIGTKHFEITNCAFLFEERYGNYYDGFLNPGSDTFLLSNSIITDSLSRWSLFNSDTKSVFLSHNSFGFFDCNDQLPNVTCGPGNLSGIDPLFRDTAAGDYTLLPCSPLINAGSNVAAAGLLTDLAGNPRILEGVVDIGVYEAPAFVQAAEPLIKPACTGASNGSITVSPAYGCEPYTYQWDPAAGNGPELNGLPPGPYRLTITDGSGRQIKDTLQVGIAPVPELALTSTDVQCGATLGGTLTSGVSGGTPPYQHQWLPTAPDTSFVSQLGPGQYALTVTDAHGCQDSASAQISLQGLITLLVNGQAIPCYGETGWLSATPVTGAAPFTWQWQGWAGTDSLAQPLEPGAYAVTVSDVYGCTASFAYPPMTQPDSLWAITTAVAQTQNNPPNGEAAVLAVQGGKSPYEFLWSTGSTMQTIEDLQASSYIVTITDKNGCTIVYEIVVEYMVSTHNTGAEVTAVLLYPNPATEWVQLELPVPEQTWHLILSDKAGRVVIREQTAASEYRLNLYNLAAGIYLLQIQDDTGAVEFVKEVIKR